MGKAKKQRKGAKGEESDSEMEVDNTELIEKPTTKKTKAPKDKEDVENEQAKPAIKTKKSNKKKDKQESDSEEDIPIAKTQSAFALLQVEDSEEDAVQSDNESEKEEIETAPKNKKIKPEPQQGGKKGKKSKRKKDEDDDELERALAELEMEYSGVKKDETPIAQQEEQEAKPAGKKGKKKGRDQEVEEVEEKANEDEPTDGGTMKTAAQKKKEKKEREKQKKLSAKTIQKEDSEEKTEISEQNKDPEEVREPSEEKESSKKKKKKGKDKVGDEKDKEDDGEAIDESATGKKKKGAKEKEDKDAKNKKGPAKKTIAAMQEALKKIKEEEERIKREEEERLKREEEAENARLEALRLEQEKKEKKKQKEKERKERLKAEGKLLTAKQKADRARAQVLIDSLKAQGVELPDVGEKRPARLGTRIRPNKQKKEQAGHEVKDEQKAVDSQPGDAQEVPTKEDVKSEEPKEEEDDVKDTWDASSDSESEGESEENKKESENQVNDAPKTVKAEKDEAKESSNEEDSDSDEDESDSDDDDEDDEEEDGRTLAERVRERAEERIRKRKEEAEKNRSLDNLRAGVVCVLGHVDTGKTKILDKLRRTNVQDGEAGGITQQIGATNVPIEAIKEQIKIVKGASDMELKLPGLLIIDTPGHESFSNLRNRGSSLCDISILVVDIMHGLEQQTIESINLLKKKKCPFIVALNKIDRLYDWQTMNRKDVRDIIKAQARNTQLEFEERTKSVVLQFAEQGLNVALFYENPDPRSYISLVPTSAITGEGMGNLLALIVEYCQVRLPKRLMYSDDLEATVLEVKAIPGLGTTIDVILVNGTLREGETILVAGTDGPIVTQIRSLLMPQPLRELRVKNAYVEHKEVKAAQGVKIAAKDLEKAIAGLNLYVAVKPDEIEVLREEVARELKVALKNMNIELKERGVYVQASTLGSLEALLEFLKVSKIPVSGIRIGPVVKKDVMKASIMLEHESQYATILAFDVKVEKDAQELADSMGVKIFQADIIYHLFDKFMAYREELKQKKREEFKHIAVFPCKLKVLPQFVFNSRDPIVCGVMVEAGVVREGTPICVPSKDFVDIGIVTSVENNHKPVEFARKGMEVCIKIEPIPGESPKMFGRHFDETDMLVSKISRQSIDACKDYFRDDLLKSDWQLMVELKKIFQIL
ncbi:eukaryotic translation initiation factor 5B [Anthonomus grandis grandis]|uniref:eukaryotic translation initiation factor 5B n=1 Tax=Anthonomus grandis grandis TaxID=2921223 RepID=UPI0021668FFB|nr:eukaryotic translation initiation factor 5B [Anthonomus grandis grandis]